MVSEKLPAVSENLHLEKDTQIKGIKSLKRALQKFLQFSREIVITMTLCWRNELTAGDILLV